MATFLKIIGIAVLIFFIDYFLWTMLLSSFPCLGPDCTGDETSVFHTVVTTLFVVFTFPGGALMFMGLLDGLPGIAVGAIIVGNLFFRAIVFCTILKWRKRRSLKQNPI